MNDAAVRRRVWAILGRDEASGAAIEAHMKFLAPITPAMQREYLLSLVPDLIPGFVDLGPGVTVGSSAELRDQHRAAAAHHRARAAVLLHAMEYEASDAHATASYLHAQTYLAVDGPLRASVLGSAARNASYIADSIE